MKKILMSIALLLACNNSFAAGNFFNVSISGSNLSITTTIPYRIYPNAGIKINTPGYSLRNPGTDCTINGNGYCLFSASNTTKNIAISGSTAGNVSMTLCLNGAGPLSCQMNYVNYTPGPTVAYLANRGANNILLCPLTDTGGFGACASTGGAFSGPIDIVLNAAGTFAYAVNFDSSIVSVCPINSDNTFGTCSTTGSNFNSPVGIALTTTNAYITNFGDGIVSRCAISGSGTFSSCQDANPGTTFLSPEGIAINSTQSSAYIVSNGSGTVTKCAINGTTGQLSGCSVEATGLTNPELISLNAAGTKAYIASNNNTVVVCQINPDDSFGTCTTTGNTGVAFDGPKKALLNSAGTLGYVTNSGDNMVLVCPVNASGGFGACVDSGNTGAAISNVWGIALK